MDDVDVAICRMLLANARTPYSELGRALGMTAQAVHRRVQSLIDDEIVTGSGAYLTHRATGRRWMVLHGWSTAPSMSTVANRLRDVRSTVVMFVASGNHIYVHGSVGDAEDAEEFVRSVREEAALEGMGAGIVATPPKEEGDDLSRIDLRIAMALRDDARRPLTDVSDDVGASVKSIRRRLARMVDRGLLHMTIHWEPETQGDVVSNLHLRIGDDPERAAYVLIKRLGDNAIRTMSFVDDDGRMMVTVWTRNVRDMQSMCEDLESEGVFDMVVPHIIRRVHYFDANRHRDLDDMMLRVGQRDA